MDATLHNASRRLRQPEHRILQVWTLGMYPVDERALKSHLNGLWGYIYLSIVPPYLHQNHVILYDTNINHIILHCIAIFDVHV